MWRQKPIADNRFHAIAGDMAANICLRTSFDRLLIDHARSSITFYVASASDETTQAADQHDAMLVAIELGDADAAVLLADDHWAMLRHRIAQFVMPPPLRDRLCDVAPYVRSL